MQPQTKIAMETNGLYNIIGDIHGRTCWKKLIRKDYINIFVGDYFDPYEYIPQEERLSNFKDILDFKRQHPQTVLLYGNHDLHYLISDEHYSRYESCYANEYWLAFIQSQSLFHGIAYPIADKALVTHAGVTKEWYKKYFGTYQSESPVEVAKKINTLWEQNKKAFTFDFNVTEWDDNYGTSPTHSPLWIRPDSLVEHNLFAGTDIKQIIGHTQTLGGIVKDHNIICVDCLASKEKSFILEI